MRRGVSSVSSAKEVCAREGGRGEKEQGFVVEYGHQAKWSLTHTQLGIN